MLVTDLEQATKTKTASEVNTMFVDSASFILRATVGKSGAKRGAGRKGAKTGQPLWDSKKLQLGDYFSCISYLKVETIDGNKITVNNHLGGSWLMSKDILEKEMWSADHIEKEIKCTMTDLSQVLESCSDTIFKVQFKKMVDPKDIEANLSATKHADLKDAALVTKLAKSILGGETVTITGHHVQSENQFGRSLIIDLDADPKNNFRQVDHRTIEWIVFKNVKYSLGKKAPGTQELPLRYDREDQKWLPSKLAVGNWFSSSSYYKVKEIPDQDNCMVIRPDNAKCPLQMSRDIMEYEMNSGTIFAKEESLSRSNIVELLANAKECVFTVTFHKKQDADNIKSKLSAVSKDFKNIQKN